ncbi:hypothetical protein PRZ48_006520 [Zasmidium cellare]|uniref:Uncharacterized protein n=1 Tax=Zasmidium cellare TaxID=395010 RepID=A0ABR0EQK2_ZASCE|nr:hypothetical protein PRZ48_006520 [Zasmidium cellare]
MSPQSNPSIDVKSDQNTHSRQPGTQQASYSLPVTKENLTALEQERHINDTNNQWSPAIQTWLATREDHFTFWMSNGGKKSNDQGR